MTTSGCLPSDALRKSTAISAAPSGSLTHTIREQVTNRLPGKTLPKNNQRHTGDIVRKSLSFSPSAVHFNVEVVNYETKIVFGTKLSSPFRLILRYTEISLHNMFCGVAFAPATLAWPGLKCRSCNAPRSDTFFQ
eukprot:g59174.t1